VNLPHEAFRWAQGRRDAILFSEAQTRVILSASNEAVPAIQSMAQAHGLACYRIGETGGEEVAIAYEGEPLIRLSLQACRNAYENAIPRWMERRV